MPSDRKRSILTTSQSQLPFIHCNMHCVIIIIMTKEKILEKSLRRSALKVLLKESENVTYFISSLLFFQQQNKTYLFWNSLQLVFWINILPYLFHVIPVFDNAMFHRITNRQKTSMLLLTNKKKFSKNILSYLCRLSIRILHLYFRMSIFCLCKNLISKVLRFCLSDYSIFCFNFSFLSGSWGVTSSLFFFALLLIKKLAYLF